jgi:hypothetical protein
MLSRKREKCRRVRSGPMRLKKLDCFVMPLTVMGWPLPSEAYPEIIEFKDDVLCVRPTPQRFGQNRQIVRCGWLLFSLLSQSLWLRADPNG